MTIIYLHSFQSNANMMNQQFLYHGGQAAIEG